MAIIHRVPQPDPGEGYTLRNVDAMLAAHEALRIDGIDYQLSALIGGEILFSDGGHDEVSGPVIDAHKGIS